MATKPAYDPNGARYYTAKAKQALIDTTRLLREDVSKINDPAGKALLETTAEALIGLTKAFDDYEKKNEEAWKTSTPR